MARLTKEQWKEARAWWESDPTVTYQQIATKYGCSRPAVGQKAESEGWTRGGEGQEQAESPKVSPPPKVSPSKPSKVSPKGGEGAPEQPAGDAPKLPQRTWELLTGPRRRGRPTDYRPEFVDELVAYFDIEVQSAVDVDVVDKEGKTRTEKKLVINTFPTLTRFAAKIGVTRETLHDWATAKDEQGALKHPEFSYAYTRAKDSQESLLVEGAMAGLYEPRFAVFAAKNLAGWKDQIETKTEVTLTQASAEELDSTYTAAMAQMEAKRAEVMERVKAAQLAALESGVKKGGRGGQG